MDVSKEIIDDPGNWDIVDIQFISFNKKKQKVERTLKLREFYLVRIIHFNILTMKKVNPVILTITGFKIRKIIRAKSFASQSLFF